MSTATAWTLIGACAVITAAIKAAGPIALGGRELPAWFSGVVALMAPALLAALVATAVFADGPRLAVGADTVGVAVAAVLLIFRVPLVLVSVVAVLVTVALRALG